MSETPESRYPLSPEKLRRPWRFVMIAGGMAAFYELTLTGAPRTKFLLADEIQSLFARERSTQSSV